MRAQLVVMTGLSLMISGCESGRYMVNVRNLSPEPMTDVYLHVGGNLNGMGDIGPRSQKGIGYLGRPSGKIVVQWRKAGVPQEKEFSVEGRTPARLHAVVLTLQADGAMRLEFDELLPPSN